MVSDDDFLEQLYDWTSTALAANSYVASQAEAVQSILCELPTVESVNNSIHASSRPSNDDSIRTPQHESLKTCSDTQGYQDETCFPPAARCPPSVQLAGMVYGSDKKHCREMGRPRKVQNRVEARQSEQQLSRQVGSGCQHPPASAEMELSVEQAIAHARNIRSSRQGLARMEQNERFAAGGSKKSCLSTVRKSSVTGDRSTGPIGTDATNKSVKSSTLSSRASLANVHPRESPAAAQAQAALPNEDALERILRQAKLLEKLNPPDYETEQKNDKREGSKPRTHDPRHPSPYAAQDGGKASCRAGAGLMSSATSFQRPSLPPRQSAQVLMEGQTDHGISRVADPNAIPEQDLSITEAACRVPVCTGHSLGPTPDFDPATTSTSNQNAGQQRQGGQPAARDGRRIACRAATMPERQRGGVEGQKLKAGTHMQEAVGGPLPALHARTTPAPQHTHTLATNVRESVGGPSPTGRIPNAHGRQAACAAPPPEINEALALSHFLNALGQVRVSSFPPPALASLYRTLPSVPIPQRARPRLRLLVRNEEH